jgi:hypothetical protein
LEASAINTAQIAQSQIVYTRVAIADMCEVIGETSVGVHLQKSVGDVDAWQ